MNESSEAQFKKYEVGLVKSWRLDVWEHGTYLNYRGSLKQIAEKLRYFFNFSYCEVWDEPKAKHQFKGSVRDVINQIKDIAGIEVAPSPLSINHEFRRCQVRDLSGGQDKPVAVQGGDGIMPVLKELKEAVAALTVDVKELKAFTNSLHSKSITMTCHEDGVGRASRAWL
jgi:hypothetical protein